MTIMDRYRLRLAQRLSGGSFTRPSHIAVGAGLVTSGEARKLTELVDELYDTREEITGGDLTGSNKDTARLSAIFTTSAGIEGGWESNGGIWKEIGVLNAASDGDLLVRDEDANVFHEKLFGEVIVVYVKIQVA